uniref:3-beta hydroxysteroid dehydrogenase/isomerase domain-containing protein n=1 Tax=Zosterops lateralis melanops TaxID=1220523 RepID=A0A8D2PK44_ZOSLA
MDGAWVYLVTGGCGFVGERIVELLSRQDYIKEVRVFDSVAREEIEKLTATRVTVTRGDIRDLSALLAALQGVHVVLHTAALVDYRDTVPFGDMRAVNVGGTENVLRACCALSIPSLLYTSSVAAVGPNTSCEPLNGGTLRTCIIRANTIYGEKAAFLQELYLLARARNGVLNYLEPEDTERNLTYVGNVAWMHVLAARHLQLQPDLLAGQIYYCYDDTPSKKSFLVRHQLLSSADPSVRLGSHIPYWKMWLMIQLHRVIRAILPPFWRPQPFLSVALLNTIVTSFSFQTDKASRHFGYKPLFTWQESRLRTAQWLRAAAGTLQWQSKADYSPCSAAVLAESK